MQAFYFDHFVLPLPAGHRFPMANSPWCTRPITSSAWSVARSVPHLPLAFVMAVGYGRQIEETVQIQLATFRLGLSHAQRWQQRIRQAADSKV